MISAFSELFKKSLSSLWLRRYTPMFSFFVTFTYHMMHLKLIFVCLGDRIQGTPFLFTRMLVAQAPFSARTNRS